MKTAATLIFIVLCSIGCSAPEVQEIAFDKTMWNIKEGRDYPHRDQMVNEILYTDMARSQNKDGIINLLGNPDYYRSDSSYLYYRLNESRIGFWTLHTKSLVIKLTEDNSVEWIKIHE